MWMSPATSVVPEAFYRIHTLDGGSGITPPEEVKGVKPWQKMV